MKTKALALSACLTLLCSCSTLPNWSDDDSARPPLPAEASFNNGAGDADPLFVMLRSENGEKLLFGVDTGMPLTVLDKSLESKLGERLGTSEANYSWFGKTTVGVYSAPKLYLGDTQLLLNDRILTDDLSKLSLPGHPLMGILGLDCLRHYCIQLDFAAGKMRFLDPDNLDTNILGKAFPMNISNGGAFTRADFFGLKNTWLKIDTGCTIDAALKPKFVQQKLQEQKAEMTNETKTAAGVSVRFVYFEKIALDGNTYRHFILSDCADDNLLGLRFMGRHLATLNFPEKIMYLRRNMEIPAVADDFTKEAQKFLSDLKGKGQLPGWLKEEPGKVSARIPDEKTPDIYPIFRAFIAAKNGDDSLYHYVCVKASKDSTWKLQRAWQTDANGKVLKEYSVP